MLTVSLLVLGGANPHIVLTARDGKSRNGAELPLRGDLVDDIRNRLKIRRNDVTTTMGDDSTFRKVVYAPKELIKALDRDRSGRYSEVR